MNNSRRSCFVCGACLLAGLICLTTNIISQVKLMGAFETSTDRDRKDWMKFAPKRNFTECAELFDNTTDAANFQMSDDFKSGLEAFLLAVKIATNKSDPVEGHSYQYDMYYKTLHYLAKELTFVRTVCETGFNAGHSAFNFLSAKPSTVLHTFDIGQHKYTRPMARYLEQKFPDRFHVHFGDSRSTLPAFIANHSSSVSCNLFHVDGGHSGDVPLKDLINLSRLADLKNNVVFMDNVNYPAVDNSWRKMVQSGFIREQMRCKMHKPLEDEFAIGYFVKPANTTN